jgi:hypothetical protein
MIFFKTFFVFSCLVIFFSACIDSKQKLTSYQVELKKAEGNFKSMKDEEWIRLDAKMENLRKEIDDPINKYSSEQIKEANNLLGRYQALRLKRNIEGVNRYIENATEQLNGFLKSLDTDSSTNN